MKGMGISLKEIELSKIALLLGGISLFVISSLFQDYDFTCFCFRINGFYPIAGENVSGMSFVLNKLIRLAVVLIFSLSAAVSLLNKNERYKLFKLYLILQIAIATCYFIFALIVPQLNFAILLHQLAFTPILMVLLIVFKRTQKT